MLDATDPLKGPEPVRILAVDDDPAALCATVRVLRSAGYQVIEASTGAAALAAAAAVELVVLDVNLPDIDGFEVCRRLRARPDTSQLPVLHLSATFADSAHIATGFEAGVDGYLTRPVEAPVLLATVRTLLFARHARESFLASERAARAEAKRSNRVKEEFLATLSHELRNPLNAILGWATVLSRKPDLPEPLLHGLKAIERNSRLQAQMISDLLDYAGIAFGNLRLVTETVDPYPIIRAAWDAVRGAAQAAGVEIRASFDDEPLNIEADAARLQQIVWNLLTNAVKFSAKGAQSPSRPGAAVIVLPWW
jgi:signal transduction histidine kinase